MLNWSLIDTVLLDMDGTLLDLHFDSYFWRELVPRRYAELHALTIEEARAQMTAKYQAVSGTLSWYCLDYWQRELSLDILAMKREISHLITLRPNVTTFLQRLRDSGRQVVLLTNAHPQGLSLKMERTALAPYFDRLISTHEIGHAKESQALWQGLGERLDYQPERTLFVDDSEPVLRSAQTFGIGQLLGINNPDSRGPAQQLEGFDCIGDYAEIIGDIK